jgi:hypothetical protein
MLAHFAFSTQALTKANHTPRNDRQAHGNDSSLASLPFSLGNA